MQYIQDYQQTRLDDMNERVSIMKYDLLEQLQKFKKEDEEDGLYSQSDQQDQNPDDIPFKKIEKKIKRSQFNVV